MFYADLLASRRNGTLYAGMTDDLRARVERRQRKHFDGFTARYGVDRLVRFESHPSRDQAFVRERQIKEWRRLWKIQLIEARNPNWRDLYPDLDRLMMEDELRGLRPYATTPPLLTARIPPIPHNPLIPAKAGTQSGSCCGGANHGWPPHTSDPSLSPKS